MSTSPDPDHHTALGIVGGADVIEVSAAAVVGSRAAGCAIDWWVGAEDRWHLASREAAVRQSLADDGSTIETRLKVPGGDVVHRVATVPFDGDVLARMELQNATAVPVAIAVVVCLDEAAAFAVVDDTITADGVAVLRASRGVARAFIGDEIDEVARAVDAGDAMIPADLAPSTRGSVAVAIFPLPHTAVLEVTLAPTVANRRSTHARDELPPPAALPPFDAIVRGWASHTGHAARFSCPDSRLVTVLEAARRHLLGAASVPLGADLWATDPNWAPAVAAVALDGWGHHLEARDLLLAASGPDDLELHAARPIDEAGALLWGWAECLERRPDPELAAALEPFIEQLAIRLLQGPRRRLFGRGPAPSASDSQWRAVGLAAASSLLTRMGSTAAGADIVDALGGLVDSIVVGDDDARARRDADLPLALGGRRLGLDQSLLPSLSAIAAQWVTGERGVESIAGLVAAAGPTGALGGPGRSHELAASALTLAAARRIVVDEPGGVGGPLALLSNVPAGWIGGAIEAHGVPIGGGTVSYAARWHGARPAMLWELDIAGDAPELRAPGLDPGWSLTPDSGDVAPDGALKGEALLAASTDIDIGAMESPHVARGETLDIADEPDSFA